jgi:hypothetical protein
VGAVTRFTALLRLWRDADELRTVVDHSLHLTAKLDHARLLVNTYRERLTRAELIEISQGAYIAELQAELEEAHAECVRIGRLLHPSRGTE